MKKTNPKKQIKRRPRSKKAQKSDVLLSLGKINPNKGRILLLVVLIILVSSVLIMQQTLNSLNAVEPQPIQSVPVKKVTPLEREISQKVEGYPIEKMLPYIYEQDPKVAAFMIAIAKKESAWGKRHPVLNGQDCYNYWGFRLKSDKMGSGGHTCFDSPQQAVETVGNRIDELVNDEKIDSPREMIVWKCGYACQNKTKKIDEQKWIKDVNYYYSQFENYL